MPNDPCWHADLLADNPFNTLKLGCDFLRHHALPHVDFATAHLWPDTWLPAGASDAAKLRFVRCAAQPGSPCSTCAPLHCGLWQRLGWKTVWCAWRLLPPMKSKFYSFPARIAICEGFSQICRQASIVR